MSKTQKAYTPEQERAMAIARVERKMSAPDVIAAAHAGELDGLESFDPSISTVDRCKRALEEERREMSEPARYAALSTRVFALVEVLTREIEDEHHTTGKVNATRLRHLTMSQRNLHATLSKPPAKVTAKDRPEPETNPPTTPTLMGRLAQQSGGKKLRAQSTDTEPDTEPDTEGGVLLRAVDQAG